MCCVHQFLDVSVNVLVWVFYIWRHKDVLHMKSYDLVRTPVLRQIFFFIYRHWIWSEVSHFPRSRLTVNNIKIFDKQSMCMLDSTTFLFCFDLKKNYFAINLQTFFSLLLSVLDCLYGGQDDKCGHTSAKSTTIFQLNFWLFNSAKWTQNSQKEEVITCWGRS